MASSDSDSSQPGKRRGKFTQRGPGPAKSHRPAKTFGPSKSRPKPLSDEPNNESVSGGTVKLVQDSTGQWLLHHPRCVQDRELDLADVEEMLEADEIDVARDELRYLLNGCTDHIGIHFMLGEIALAEKDIALARGHYGYAFQIGERAITRANSPRPIPSDHPANELWYHAGKQLAWCLKLLEKPDLLKQVVDFLVQCDARDLLQVRELV